MSTEAEQIAQEAADEMAEAEGIRIDAEIRREEESFSPSPGPSVTLDAATLIAMMQQMGADNRETMLAAIAEMKKPNAKVQAKEEAEEAREYALMMQRINEAKRQEEDQAAAQLTCSHTRPDGKTRLRAQVLTNGYSQAFCPECHALSAPFICAAHELTGGMNMDGWGGQAWAIVQQRVKNSPPPPPVPRLPPGARIQF